jgi:hypothetical protein
MTQTSIVVLLLLVTVAVSGTGSAQDHPPEGEVLTARALLTNGSIVSLTHAGISQETIVRMVQTQAGKYALGTEDVIALKDAGVSDVVVGHSALGCGPR